MTVTAVPAGLLAARGPSLTDHLAAHGALPGWPPGTLAEAVDRAGLTGRGGGGSPTARKVADVLDAARATRRRAVVLANGAEGDPAAHKDALLLTRVPHLVLDGLQLVAGVLDAATAVVAAGPGAAPAVAAALSERRDVLPVRLHAVAGGFLAGEESALVSAVDGGPPLPRAGLTPVRERGVGGAPTLVLNVETLARLALIARGDVTAGSRALVTRHTAVGGRRRADVAEVPLGARLDDVLTVGDDVQAVLVGGYHGTWLPVSVARGLRLDRESLASVGASLGAGVLAGLPADRCGLRETAAVLAYLAAESAGRCGACVDRLPRTAAALDLLASPGSVPPATADRLQRDVARWSGLVAGRGACSHPDGSLRLAAGALRVFAPEVAAHRAGRCSAAVRAPFLPVPAAARVRAPGARALEASR